jgi:hypothetical protein
MVFASGNGRGLEYDNSHGHCHRHYLDNETPIPEMPYKDGYKIEFIQKRD